MKQNKIPRVLLAVAWQSYDMAAGAVRYATEAGWHLDMTSFMTGELPEVWEGDGLLSLFGEGKKVMRLVEACRCPAVSLTVNRGGMDLPYVDVDNENVGRLAARYLLERNFQHFAYYSLTDLPVDILRGKNFSGIVNQAGHDCETLTWSQARGRRRNSWDSRQDWLKKKLRQLPKPVAVFAVDDLRAVELIEAALQSNMRIPEDVAILGVGNHELLSNTTAVPLSSVTIDERRIGYEAARLLDLFLHGEKPTQTHLLIAPSVVVGRKSTDTIATKHPEVAKAIRFILDNYQEPFLAIGDILAATTCSQASLYQAFHAELACTPVQLLTKIRLDHAKYLLTASSDTVGVIAQKCGFGAAINLFRNFKRLEGITPTQYRKQGSCG